MDDEHVRSQSFQPSIPNDPFSGQICRTDMSNNHIDEHTLTNDNMQPN